MTPQIGGNVAFQRRQPVRPCPDETISDPRFGICIRKTQYRKEQEDRVSSPLLSNKRWTKIGTSVSIFEPILYITVI